MTRESRGLTRDARIGFMQTACVIIQFLPVSDRYLLVLKPEHGEKYV